MEGGSSGEEGGGDASKNAWYIKMIDEPPGPLYVAYGVKETGEVGGKGMGGLSRT